MRGVEAGRDIEQASEALEHKARCYQENEDEHHFRDDEQSAQTPLHVTHPYWRRPTNAHLVAPNTVTFLDREIPAWFRLTLGPAHRPTVLHMTAAAHFMTDRYRGYDVPVTLSPPSR